MSKNLRSSTFLKLNYLSEPALTLVMELDTIAEIWECLTKSYGNARVLLQNKLGELAKMGGLEKMEGEEKWDFRAVKCHDRT